MILKKRLLYIIIFLVSLQTYAFAEEIRSVNLSNEECLECHADVNVKHTVHKGKDCVDCHIDIKALPHKKDLQRIKCTLCHVSMTKSLGMDVHERARKKGNLNAPSCTSCHGKHNIAPRTKIDSPMNPKYMLSFCSTCHPDVPIKKDYHKKTKLTSKVCQGCHGEKDGEICYVDLTEFKKSIHRVLDCIDCHNDINKVPHSDDLNEVECGHCHEKAGLLYDNSVHGKARNQGIMDAPQCWDCHGSHNVLPPRDSASSVYPKQVSTTCGNIRCHSNPLMAKKHNIPYQNPLKDYEKSVHAKKIAGGKIEAATCNDCHGSHGISTLTDVLSPIYKGNVPKTCSKCHTEIFKEFITSAHWKGYLKGARKAPVCNDCHREHKVLSPRDPDSSVFTSQIPTLCTDCHENSQIAERYDIPVMTLDSYNTSYHGLALKGGNLEAANCTSCHSKHKILHSADPDSSVNKANLGNTCGKCHPGMGDKIEVTSVHTKGIGKSALVNKIVEIVYIILIIMSVLGMFAFCLLDLISKAKQKEAESHNSHPEFTNYHMRFTFTERIIHFTLFISFVILVYTGFAHSYPESIWAYPVTKFLPAIFRDVLHRLAGVILILNMVAQVILFIYTKRGREQFLALLPNKKDYSDAVQLFIFNFRTVFGNLLYKLPGKRIEKLLNEIFEDTEAPPKYARFNFIEKFEYWALIWGTILMTVTGLGLWFKELTLLIFPSWVIDLFLILHFYEALLATLAILIWHFYWAIFDPHVYPMDTSWIDGNITEERLQNEYTLEWEDLQKRG